MPASMRWPIPERYKMEAGMKRILLATTALLLVVPDTAALAYQASPQTSPNKAAKPAKPARQGNAQGPSGQTRPAGPNAQRSSGQTRPAGPAQMQPNRPSTRP